MTRKRIAGTALQSYQDVDSVLRKIGELDRKLDNIETATNEAIDKAKQAARQSAEPLKATKASLERQLKEFCESRKLDFAEVRARELTFGVVGFRKSTSVVIKAVADTLAALKALGLSQCIRTKEEVDKEAMRDLSEETLSQVGASLKVVDAFGYEIKREQIPETA